MSASIHFFRFTGHVDVGCCLTVSSESEVVYEQQGPVNVFFGKDIRLVDSFDSTAKNSDFHLQLILYFLSS